MGDVGQGFGTQFGYFGGGFHAQLDAFLGEFGSASRQGDAGHFGSGVKKGAVGVFNEGFGKVGSAGVRVLQGLPDGFVLAVQGFRSTVFDEFFGVFFDVFAEIPE